MARFVSTKTFGAERGFAVAYRQWKADTHCNLIHGYSLGFHMEFSCDERDLDARNWVVDFGGLKGLKAMLEDTFDHKLLVAKDDPEIEWFREAHKRGIADIVEVEAGGCEKFAELVYLCSEQWLKDAGFSPRCRLVSVEVSEHGANSAIYQG